MTIYEAVQKAKKCLGDSNVPDCGIDALILLQSVCGIDRTGYYGHGDEELPDAERYLEKVRLRAQRIPLQQITGKQYFCGLEFQVTEDVLCPRPETELLVEEALKHLGRKDRILDLCTGSGCIAISLLRLGQEDVRRTYEGELPGKNPTVGSNLSHGNLSGGKTDIFHQEMFENDSCMNGKILSGTGLNACGCDLSGDALKIAAVNARMNQVSDRLALVQSDLYDGVCGVFDMIVSNPPYIASGEIDSLMPEVRDHEPRMALDGGADGLVFYRRILDGSRKHLKPDGWLIVEIGYDQGNDVRSMFIDHGYDSVRVIRDLSGLDRVVAGRNKGVTECLTS